MSQSRSRRLRRLAVVEARRRVGDPPPSINVHVAARHCWRCRLCYRISGLALALIRRHNVEASAYVERVREYVR